MVLKHSCTCYHYYNFPTIVNVYYYLYVNHIHTCMLIIFLTCKVITRIVPLTIAGSFTAEDYYYTL